MFRLVLSLALVLLCTNASAGGSGNPVEPVKSESKHLNVAAAFGYDYTASRLFDLDFPGSDTDEMNVSDLHQVYGKVILGRNETSNLYAKVGGAFYDLSFDDDAKVEIDTEGGIFTGLGINVLRPFTEIENFNLDLGFDIQANLFINDVDGISRAGVIATAADGTLYGVDGKSSVYLAYKHDIEDLKTKIVPYLGAYHSWITIGTFDDLSYNATGVDYDHEISASYDILSFGPMVGLDVDIADSVTFNVEGRFVGENGLTAGATIRY